VVFEKLVGGVRAPVVRVRVPGGSMPVNSTLVVSAPQADVLKGLSEDMARRIPYIENGDEEEVLAGAANTMVHLDLRDRVSREKIAFLNDEVRVELMVDTTLLRRRGGCYTPESNTVTVCLPGYVGLFRSIDDATRHEWQVNPVPRHRRYPRGTNGGGCIWVECLGIRV
jgi:hypothetical protein